MRRDNKGFFWFLNMLILLILVSAYRQFSRYYLPNDPARPYIVYAVYLFLVLFWAWSLKVRVTQRSTRFFLLAESGVMLFWLTVRFIQDAFLTSYIYPTRLCGYLINVAAVAIPLLALYAAFGLGRADSYRPSPKWYLLWIPAAALILMALTNEYHHFLCYVDLSEPQPNLYFHPYIGMYIIFLWDIVLIIARVCLIYRRGNPRKSNSPIKKLIPFFEIIALVIFCIPYALSAFLVKFELIEFSAGVFFIEAASWELFIYIGLVPVNTSYEEVFERSTVNMRILTKDGLPFAASSRAREVPPELFERLKRDTIVTTPDGEELRLHELRGGYLIWRRNVSRLNAIIAKLRENSAELEQDHVLLSQELKLKSEESAVSAQNHIYNALTEEVGGQLTLLKNLLAKKDTAVNKTLLFREICLIGTYVKRRCDLRLIERSEGVISIEDLSLSFRDMIRCLLEMGTDARSFWLAVSPPSPGFSLFAIDLFEFLLEYERFEIASVEAVLENDLSFSIALCPAKPRAGFLPDRELKVWSRDRYPLKCSAIPGGYKVILRERSDSSHES